MKEHPVLFKGSMVRAIQAKKKTQTRRVITSLYKKRITSDDLPYAICRAKESGWVAWYGKPDTNREKLQKFTRRAYNEGFPAPLGDVGDQLWVRETWRIGDGANPEGDPTKPTYAADWLDDLDSIPVKWRPSIFMPRQYSRIQLEITDVRAQRLQEITAIDALAEGITETDFWRPKDVESRPFEEKWWDDYTFWENYPQLAFRNLWDSINGKRDGGIYSWEANPPVFAYTFRDISEEARKAA